MAGNNSAGIASAISDLAAAVGADPCLAALVLVVLASFWWTTIIHGNMQKNEERRMDQVLRATAVGAEAAQRSTPASASDQ